MPWYDYSPGPLGELLPLAEIFLVHNGRAVRVVALVDSGADTSLIDASHAVDLGLDRGVAEVATLVGADGARFNALRWSTTSLEIQFEGERVPFDFDQLIWTTSIL